MRLVKLTRFDDEPIWVNPALVLHVTRVPGTGSADYSSNIQYVGESWERVRECPQDVAAMFLDPLR